MIILFWITPRCILMEGLPKTFEGPVWMRKNVLILIQCSIQRGNNDRKIKKIVLCITVFRCGPGISKYNLHGNLVQLSFCYGTRNLPLKGVLRCP